MNTCMGTNKLRNHAVRRGVTLVELLCCIAILLVISAVVYPVVAKTKSRSSDAVTISNLRQCGMALLLYAAGEDGTMAIPPASSVSEVLRLAPTCDPKDSWRAGCSEPSTAPMVGSYAYVRSAPRWDQEVFWDRYMLGEPQPTLLLSIFSSTTKVLEFDCLAGPAPDTARFPDRTARFFADGSVKFTHDLKNPRLVFDWETLFSLKRLSNLANE